MREEEFFPCPADAEEGCEKCYTVYHAMPSGESTAIAAHIACTGCHPGYRFEDEERCEKEGEHGEEFKHIYEPCPATYDSCCICMKD